MKHQELTSKAIGELTGDEPLTLLERLHEWERRWEARRDLIRILASHDRSMVAPEQRDPRLAIEARSTVPLL